MTEEERLQMEAEVIGNKSASADLPVSMSSKRGVLAYKALYITYKKSESMAYPSFSFW